MEANTNRVPEDITQIQHQTASWQVCWWAQTRLRVETQLLSYDILNFCPTKSSHILSGLENLPFPPQGTEAERQKSERRRTRQLRESEIWVTASRSLLQQDVFTLPVDLPYLFEHKVALHGHTAQLSCNPNFCQALPQTSSLHPGCQQVWVHTINLDRAKRERKWWRGIRGRWKRWESGSEDSDRSEGSCPFSTSVFLQNRPQWPGSLSVVWRWQLVRDLWGYYRLALTLP